jgi:mRNA-degrading endonuclease RelE of RelBE toxin-antitoxin system
VWKVTETKQAAKEVRKLPKGVALIYQVLMEDLTHEGPRPHGWDVKSLKGRPEVRIRLNREYRVLIVVIEPDLIVVKVAHRKEVYE